MKDPILQFFVYEHLPAHLQAVSAPFCILARWTVDTLPNNSERMKALDALLAAKDCAVRASLWKWPIPGVDGGEV